MVNKTTILKNTLWLYMRMFIVTAIALYTSRVVLRALGVNDFGIYSAVGGIIAFFSVVTSSMSNGTLLFLNIKKGNSDSKGLSLVFKISKNIHNVISVVFFIIAEIIGSIIVLYVMNFPEGKLLEAYLVYQATILASTLSIMRIPYYSLFTTFERFDFVAWTSLLDAFLKLLLVSCIEYLSSYRLVAYGFSFVIMALLQNYLYTVKGNKLCTKMHLSYNETIKHPECRGLLSFSSWNLLGNMSNVFANHGIAILLNIFYTVTVNAAIGLTNQVTNTIATFVNNVQQAFHPQMLQSYANKDKSDFLSLLHSSTKWSFFLILLIAVPLISNIKFILKLWLGDYPLYTDSFITILTGYLIIDSISNPLSYCIDATGRIKRFQILMSLLYMFNFIIAYISCKYHFSPNIAIMTKVLTNLFIYTLKLITLKKLEKKFIISDYLKRIFPRLIIIGLFSLLFILYFKEATPSFITLIKSTLLFFIFYAIIILSVGLNKNERNLVLEKVKRIIYSINKNR